jgi:hypothetical protein
MRVLTGCVIPGLLPSTEKKPETHKQTKNSTNLNTQKHTHKEHTNQHARAEGQRDRAASCDGNKPHKNQQHPIIIRVFVFLLRTTAT